MSTFACLGKRVTIAPHPDADRLDIATIDGYQCIVGRGLWKTGDVGVYIPEQAVLPDPLIEEMELTGRLAGSGKNRVKAIRLRGVLSQGLLYRPENAVPGLIEEGRDYAADLDIKKWEPEIPLHLAGSTYRAPTNSYGASIPTYTEIENIKKFPDVLTPGEEVVAVEKCHGTCTIIYFDGERFHVTSKGIAKRGLALERTDSNVYWRAFESLPDSLTSWASGINPYFLAPGPGFALYGETWGVQDLMYGLTKGQVRFAAFDMARADGTFLDYGDFTRLMSDLSIPILPTIYRGPYDYELIRNLSEGAETISGGAKHIREGVVVRPVKERHVLGLGRVIVKSVGEGYLLRKGDSTEFE